MKLSTLLDRVPQAPCVAAVGNKPAPPPFFTLLHMLHLLAPLAAFLLPRPLSFLVLTLNSEYTFPALPPTPYRLGRTRPRSDPG